MAIEEDFQHRVGVPLDKVVKLYQQAVENDWRTVQMTTQQTVSRFAAGAASGHEAKELMNLTRAILKGEPAAMTRADI